MEIAGLTAGGVRSLEGTQLLDVCRKLALEANRLDALQAQVAAQIWASSEGASGSDSLARQHGCRSSVELIQRLTGVSARTASARVKLGRLTRSGFSLLGEQLAAQQEHLSAALESGAMCCESANYISRMLAQAATPSNSADLNMAERCLAQAATGLDFQTGDAPSIPLHADDVRVLCRKWQEALDPDGAEPNDDLVQARRSLNIGPVRGGLSRLTGLVTSEVAAGLGVICDALNNPRAGTHDSGGSGGDGPDGNNSGDDPTSAGPADESQGDGSDGNNSGNNPSDSTDIRSPGQKRHDALATALNVALASRQLPVLQGASATIVVEVREETLRQEHGTAWVVDHEGSPAPISLDSLRQLACGAAIQTLVRDSLGRITQLGTPARIFNANQRRAIALRDGGCVIPGCTVPAVWCEVHHVQPHCEGGATHTDNGVLLCHYHHHSIDSSGWRVSMRSGLPVVEPPDWLRRTFHVDKQPGSLGHAPIPPGLERTCTNQLAADQTRRLRDKLDRARKHADQRQSVRARVA